MRVHVCAAPPPADKLAPGSQARVDLYDASQSTATGLADYLFSSTSATAGPWLGNAFSTATIQATAGDGWQNDTTVDLSAYVGYAVYVVARQVNNRFTFAFGAPRQPRCIELACRQSALRMQA